LPHQHLFDFAQRGNFYSKRCASGFIFFRADRLYADSRLNNARAALRKRLVCENIVSAKRARTPA